jgi:hypothetical protein
VKKLQEEAQGEPWCQFRERLQPRRELCRQQQQQPQEVQQGWTVLIS